MKKNQLILVLLALLPVYVEGQIVDNINAPYGTISVGCDEYTNNLYRIWNVDIGSNEKVKVEYNTDIEGNNWDKIRIYSIDESGTSHELYYITGSANGTVYSMYPTGKIRIEFTTDGSVCCFDDECYTDWYYNPETGEEEEYEYCYEYYYGYDGFDISFSADDRTTFGTSIFNGPVEFNSPVHGNSTGGALRVQTNYGYLDLGPQDVNYAHLFTNKSYFLFNRTIHLQNGMIGSTNSSNLYFQTNGSYRMSILNSNGNVGIGTTYPYTKLQVNGNVYLPSGNSYWIGSYSDSGNRLRMHHNGSDAYIDYAPNLYFRSGVTNMVTFHNNGNVGIGCPASNYKLEVNGIVRAKEVKIENINWPDYVFSKDYKLPTLHDVSSHIEENRRLPDMPSAETIAKEGVNLSEINAKFLQKIEEMTLYMIQQQKLIEKQQKLIETLEKRIGNIENNIQ